MTTTEQNRKLERINQDKIYTYHLKQAEKDIAKGNETIKVLYNLLLKEINQHNGAVTKRYNKVRNTATN